MGIRETLSLTGCALVVRYGNDGWQKVWQIPRTPPGVPFVCVCGCIQQVYISGTRAEAAWKDCGVGFAAHQCITAALQFVRLHHILLDYALLHCGEPDP
jgi:hypothetical protein